MKSRAVVVVKWSACSPSTPTIRVRIPQKPSVFSVKCVLEKNKNKQKESGVGPLKTFNSGCGTVAERSLPTLDDSGSNPRLTVKK